MEKYKICVNKNFLTFSSGHFVIFEKKSQFSHPCESLHGHNYKVGVEIEGTMNEKNGYILDFGVIKNIIKEILNPLDHKVIVPLNCSSVKVERKDETVILEFREKRYVLPLVDVALLPITNGTSEMLAKFILYTMLEKIKQAGIDNLKNVQIEVEENFGQSAKCLIEL